MNNPSEWRVSSQYDASGQKIYIAYRLRDVNEVDHSGNREYYGNYNTDKKAVQKIVNELNEKE